MQNKAKKQVEMKDAKNMTKKELLAIENFMPEKDYNAIVIVPTKYIHDSGFRCMKFILCYGTEIVGAVSGCADVIHLNGIGGYGLKTKDYGRNKKGYGWRIDCLPKSNCVRLFLDEDLTLGDYFLPISDFEIYVKE